MAQTTKYYKFINVQDGVIRDDDFVYNMGLNVIENFNDRPDCITTNAFDFADIKHIHKFILFGNTLFEISIPSGPNGARIVQVGNDRYKTDKIIIERKLDQPEDEHLLNNIYTKAALSCGYLLEHVPNKYQKYELYHELVQSYGWELRWVPVKYMTPELCSTAVQSAGWAIQFVPDEYKTYELYLQAVQSAGWALKLVPDEYKTYELCLLAVQSNGRALKHVPEEYKTYDLCLQATQTSKYAMDYVPDHIRPDILKNI